MSDMEVERVKEALVKAEMLIRRANAGELLFGGVYERLAGLLRASSGPEDALDAAKMVHELEKVVVSTESGLLGLVAGSLLASKVLETHRRLDEVLGALGTAGGWRESWEADKKEQQRRLEERIELSTTDMLVRELDASDNLKTLKRMVFELKLGAKASVETLELLNEVIRRAQPGIELAVDKRREEREARGNQMRGQLLAQIAIK